MLEKELEKTKQELSSKEEELKKNNICDAGILDFPGAKSGEFTTGELEKGTYEVKMRFATIDGSTFSGGYYFVDYDGKTVQLNTLTGSKTTITLEKNGTIKFSGYITINRSGCYLFYFYKKVG